jgi:hypothetical protein
MTDMTVPRDPRPQFSELAVMLANNARGRMPLDGVEKVGPDRYVVAGWWPQTVPARGSWASTSSGKLVEPEPEAPRSTASALALWPNMK